MGRENILLLACLYYCCPFDIGISVSMGVGHILKFYIKVFFSVRQGSVGGAILYMDKS